MLMFRNLIAGAATLALVATTATPAAADWGGGYRHHDHDDDHSGAIVAGILGIGILAAIVSSASDHGTVYQEGSAPPPSPPPAYPYSYRNGSGPGPQNYAPGGVPTQSYAAEGGQLLTENDAVDGCAGAAQSQAGRYSSISSIREVRSVANGWDVKGTIAQRGSYRDDSTASDFKCSVRYGAVQSVRIDDNFAY